MPRATNNPASRRRRKKVLNRAKGYYQGRRKQFQLAKETVKRGLRYAYRDRKVRKRDFRRLWIARINAAVRANDITYSRFMAGLRLAGVEIDRKMLSELAIHDAAGFAEYVNTARKALENKKETAAA
jgi:large subunit ribosomal protein L20